MPIGIQRLNARRSQPNPLIIFIKSLKGPHERIAQQFLERIAAQCVPVMRAHHISIMTLEEYEPNREFVGRNFNAGEVIQLVLRARGGSEQSPRWLPFNYVQMVMMHELAHCKQMNHSRAFWTVRNGFADEMRALWTRGYTGDGVWGRGTALGASAPWESNAVGLDEEMLPEQLCGGTFRSRGRRGKRKAKEELSYQERKERRILKKFGPNGVALGADEEAKVKLEGGKKVQGKPRVAASARGRELRAAAAQARFEKGESQQNGEEKTRKEEDTAESDTEYEEEEDKCAVDAVDIDGTAMVDRKGRGLLRVCGDAGEDNDSKDDVHRELLELRAASQSTRPRPVLDTFIQATPSSREHSPLLRRVKVEIKDEEDDDIRTQLRNLPKERREEEKTQRIVPKQESPPPRRVPPAGNDAPSTPSLPSHTQPSLPTPSARRTNCCALCSFENAPLSITCGMCANVLDPASVPGSWACTASSCGESGYTNAGDCGVCGLCGTRRP